MKADRGLRGFRMPESFIFWESFQVRSRRTVPTGGVAELEFWEMRRAGFLKWIDMREFLFGRREEDRRAELG